jgi:hypothetical protein
MSLHLKTELSEVVQIANNIRTAFEALAERSNRDKNLCGYCARASVQLFLAAQAKGHDVKISIGDGHIYNIFQDYIIDITATQFGKKKKIWIVRTKRNQIGYWRNPYFGRNPLCNSIDELYNKIWAISKKDIYNDQRFVRKYLKN